MKIRYALYSGLVLGAFVSTGCSPSFKLLKEGGLNLSSECCESNSIYFSKPDSDVLLQPSIPLELDIQVETIANDKVKSLVLKSNGQVLALFSEPPFQMNLETAGKIVDGKIKITATAEYKDGSKVSKDLVIINGDGSNNPWLESGNGVTDANCSNDSAYDACIIWKNPVAALGHPFSPALKMGDNLSDVQIYGVKIEDTDGSGRLSNSSINVYATGGVLAHTGANGWKVDYKNDASQGFLGQEMAYYWLNYTITNLEKRAGVFFAKDRGLQVDAKSFAVTNNAYFDPGYNSPQIIMGVNRLHGNQELALSADIYIHELGHANLYYASPSTSLSIDPSKQDTDSCLRYEGCIGAIHEGQADFHAALIFSHSPAIGETFFNSMDGLTGRNLLQNSNLTAQAAFAMEGGEIHQLGAVYASILWEIYSSSDVIKLEFEKIFVQHLSNLDQSSDFFTGKQALLAQDLAMYDGKYQQTIMDAFNRRGL